jgi:hypothetical protein
MTKTRESLIGYLICRMYEIKAEIVIYLHIVQKLI